MRNYFRKARTALPNGKKPSYADLEQSFLVTYELLNIKEKEIKRLTVLNAGLRYDLSKVSDGIINPDESKYLS